MFWSEGISKLGPPVQTYKKGSPCEGQTKSRTQLMTQCGFKVPLHLLIHIPFGQNNILALKRGRRLHGPLPHPPPLPPRLALPTSAPELCRAPAAQGAPAAAAACPRGSTRSLGPALAQKAEAKSKCCCCLCFCWLLLSVFCCFV